MKKNKKYLKSNQQAFTLVEMLVSIFILMIVVLGVSGIYVNSLKVQKKAIEMNRVQQDIQFIMDTLAKKIRYGEINYGLSSYDELGSNQLVINQFDENNPDIFSPIFYKKISEKISFCAKTTEIDCFDNINFSALNTDKISITSLKFFVSPVENPYRSGADMTNFQLPRVTISMQVEGGGEVMKIEQTMPQRVFYRP